MMVNDATYAAVKRIVLNIEGAPFLIVKLDVRSPRSKVAPSSGAIGLPHQFCASSAFPESD
jgi:hypothetical protein